MTGILLVLVGACSYGVLSTFVKFAYAAGFNVGEVTGSQMLISTALIWLPVLFSRHRVKLSGTDALRLAGVGLCIGLTGLFYYGSLQYLSASVAIIMLFQFTWIGVLIEAVLQRRWPGPDKWAALVLLLAGTVLASGVLEGSQGFTLSLAGVGLGLLSAVSYALVILLSGKVALHLHHWTRSAMMTTGALAITWIVFPPEFLWNGSLPNGLWVWGSLLALFSVIPTVCFNLGVPRIDAALAVILGSAELPMAVIMSRFVLMEQVSLVQWAGVGIILLGIALPEWYQRRRSTLLDPQSS